MSLNTILFSLAVVSFIIGVYETFFFGIEGSYVFFMVSGALLLFKRYRTKASENSSNHEHPGGQAKSKIRKKVKRN